MFDETIEGDVVPTLKMVLLGEWKKEEGELGRYTEKFAPRYASFYANCKMGIPTSLYISLGKGHRRAHRKKRSFQRTETSKLWIGCF